MNRGRLLLIALLALTAVSICVWYGVLRESRGARLHVTFLNVGQGDAVFIDAPSGRQMLIDGGPDGSVLRELSRVLPWWDRSIDVLMGTHPDADHIGGLIDVLPRYRVGMIVRSSVEGSSPISEAFDREVSHAEERGTKLVIAKRGEIIDLGDGAYVEMLSPDRVVPSVETNMGCVVSRVVYGKTSFMLPCDAPQAMENYLVSLDGAALKSDVLKAGHHGSKTSSSPLFVGYVDPAYAVYSRGCDNTYGMPHAETVETFKRFGIPSLDTCTDGPVTFVSDGVTVVRE